MKKINKILSIAVLLFVFFSCEKEEFEPVIKYGDSPALTSSPDGGSFLLAEENAGETLLALSWTESDYGFPAAISYTVEMDKAGNNFAKPTDIVTTSSLSYNLTVGKLNTLLTMLELPSGVKAALEIRIKSSVSDHAQALYSEKLAFEAIPYSLKLPPIYLLGDATDPGWDNANALPAPYMSPGLYGITAHLKAGKYIKFIQTLKQWAPQWGTDGSGTNTGGKLVFRPDENATDPPAIPSPSVEGDYRIEANITTLDYIIYPIPDVVYLVGGATSIGWTPTSGLAFTKDGVGLYSITTDLSTGNGGMKIMAGNGGAWAPQWGTNATGSNLFGTLVYRASDSNPDPAEIPAPAVAGKYKIEVNFTDFTYKITKQ
jgi:hypothetical protein